MQLSKMKNIIVLRGMASNVVEEAIVVLKPHVKLKQSEYNSKGKATAESRDKKIFVVKEAENTINMYVKKLQNKAQEAEDRNFRMKYKFLQVCNVVLILSLIVGVLVVA